MMIADAATAALLNSLLWLLGRLSPATASNLGGAIARAIGPLLPVSRVADMNLRRAMPELDAGARRRVIHQVWDNLGRNAAELPHLASLRETPSGPGFEVQGREHLAPFAGRPLMFFSGHIGNWEMLLPIAGRIGVPAGGVYRPAANAAAERIITTTRRRALLPAQTLFPKGAQGARALLAFLSKGGSLGLLVDQKMNDGIAVPFFGRPAMTAPALAQMALRFGMPVLPTRVDRIGPARLRLVIEPPLDLPATGNRQADILALMTTVNARLETWIRARPGTWLWLHRRWPKDAAPVPPSHEPGYPSHAPREGH